MVMMFNDTPTSNIGFGFGRRGHLVPRYSKPLDWNNFEMKIKKYNAINLMQY